MPKITFDQPTVDPAFRQRLKRQVLATASEPKSAAVRWPTRLFFPAVIAAAVLLLLITPLITNRPNTPTSELTDVDETLSQVADDLYHDPVINAALQFTES